MRRSLVGWIFLVHRYLGIGIGLLMAVWCLSGMVMMYMPYPALQDAERLAGLEPIEWQKCCTLDDASVPAAADPIASFEIEMLDGRPVLRLARQGAAPMMIDLTSGTVLPRLTRAEARTVAQQWSDRHALASKSLTITEIDRDQWTVYGGFNADRPLYKVSLDDDAWQIYVSTASGKVVQDTSARERFWNWLGAVPHWLYPTVLRQHTSLWSQVVIWTSVIGCFLTATGIYIGLRQLGVGLRQHRLSPYRGLMLWHHVPGLFFGVLALTWVGSGLLSMNPWGALETEGVYEDMSRLSGPSPRWSTVRSAVEALRTAALPKEAVSISSAVLDGQLSLIASTSDGGRARFDTAGRPAALTAADIDAAARRLSMDAAPTRWEMISTEDAYHYSYGRHVARLPAVRIVGEHSARHYLDPVSGRLLNKVDANGRWYRWLHYGLHRMDFTATLRSRPVWDAVMLPLLLGTSLLCVSGAWLGLKRIRAKR